MAGSLIFYIDYLEYRIAIGPYVELADSENYESIIQHTQREVIPKVVERHREIIDLLDHYFALSKWPLPNRETPISWTIGEAFLIMLLGYSEQVSQDVSFGVVDIGTQLLGWTKETRELLRIGLTAGALIKPMQSTGDALIRPNLLSPESRDPSRYWWHLRGETTMSIGWWDTVSISDLSNKLRDNYEKIRTINLEPVANQLSKMHPRSLPPRETLFYHVDNLLAVYQTALDRNQGLLDIYG